MPQVYQTRREAGITYKRRVYGPGNFGEWRVISPSPEHGSHALVSAPDPLSPEQRAIVRRRDRARAIARQWAQAAEDYQAALSASKHGDERNARLFLGDAATCIENANRLPRPDDT